MGGGNTDRLRDFEIHGGLSPRGRGKLRPQQPGAARRRSIPAWAGETRPGDCRVRYRRVYPRVGGGNIAEKGDRHRPDGLSPRGRGKPYRIARRWAARRVYPRVGGGNEAERPLPEPPDGLSPRGRGNQPGAPQSDGGQGSIPAWAGEPYPGSGTSCVSAVYPRVGGGTRRPLCPLRQPPGLSPRGRGNRGGLTPYAGIPGSIPAWAGEP